MFIEQKYINDISSQLRNFKKKSNNLYNFSCPVCGDSSVKIPCPHLDLNLQPSYPDS